ncbi:hypothetical protein Tco_0718459 [Tanacetum coccineum]|uniref:Uncharacterized protein n=1 Tax=Tanacetum coccineum TaxID=301880 RepID=A0ABQ5DFZ5_9ASTR
MRNIIFMHTVQRDSILGTLRFVSKSDEYQVYGALLPKRMTNQQIRDSPAYKTYLEFATGAATPKKAKKFMKPASPTKKKALVADEEPTKKPAEKPVKKPAAKIQSTGIQIRDTSSVSVLKKKSPTKTGKSKGIELLFEVALLEEAQLKKAIKQRRHETNIHQAGGSSEGDDLELDVPDEPTGKSIDTSKGTGLKPGVSNVSKADYYESEYESWRDSDDEKDDDDQQSDDERTKSDDDNKAADINKTDEEEEDNDVNVELKDFEHEDEGKDDEEITDVGHVDAKHEEVGQEVAVQHKDLSIQTTPLLTIPVTVIPKTSTAQATTTPPPIPPFIPLQQQSTPIPTPTTIEATISTTTATDYTTLIGIHQRLADMENEVKTLKNVDHSLAIRASVKSKVPIVVKEYLGTSLDDALQKAL